MTDLAEQVAATLEAAADYIDEHGWEQKSDLINKLILGATCLVGAVAVARAGQWRAEDGIYSNPATRVLQRELDDLCWRWNDEPGREEWEVTDLLRSTAKKVRHGDLELP